MHRLLLLALLLAPIGVRAATADPPSVTVAFAGPVQSVFDTRTQACDAGDIPDMQPRAFRDDHNVVHFIATSDTGRAMLGPSLDAVKRDCHVLYHAPGDGNPAHFQDAAWLTSFFTSDGRHVAALVHTEYHGYSHPGMCDTPKGPQAGQNCWWNTIAFAQSSDGGASFTEPAPPRNLVASLPWPYDKANKGGVIGYASPSNIVKSGNFYYAMIWAWGHLSQAAGQCLIRTANPFDPKSWRAWNGKDFSVSFVDPYAGADAHPEQHVCTPVSQWVEGTQSLSIDQRTGFFIDTQIATGNGYGVPGIYLSASRDLIHWKKPTLLISTADLLKSEGPGNWWNMYAALLDPKSTDRNFMTVSESPYLYYVRNDMDHRPNTRVVFRRQIKLAVEP